MGSKLSSSKTSEEEKEVEYNDKTTGEEALGSVDLSDKVAIITGCNSGIGKETVRVLVNHNCTVIMACRDLKKAQKAKEDILQTLADSTNAETLDARMILMSLDLSSLSSVRRFVSDFNAKRLRLDYLINNAGVFGYKAFSLSADGYELQFAINHLGHFYLTQSLLPNLLSADSKNEGEPSRVIHVASATHKDSANPFGAWIDRHYESECGPLKSEYSRIGAYCDSKACTVLFARELERRYKHKLVSVAVHPGFVATAIAQNLGNYGLGHFVMNRFMAPFIKNADQGSATTLRCIAMKPQLLRGGHYYVDCKEANHIVAEHLQPMQCENEEDSQEYKCWAWSELLIQKAGFGLEADGDGDDADDQKTNQHNDNDQ